MAPFSTVFNNNLRPEVAGDVISDVAVQWVGVDVRMKFRDLGQPFLTYTRGSLCDGLRTPNERRRTHVITQGKMPFGVLHKKRVYRFSIFIRILSFCSSSSAAATLKKLKSDNFLLYLDKQKHTS